jgi:hypothetical protein
MGLFTTSNISFAAEGDTIKLSSYAGQIPTELNFTAPKSIARDMAIMSVGFGGFGIKDKAEQEEREAQNKNSYSAFLKIEEEYEKSRLKYHYILGLFLDFGYGKLSIDNLEKEIENKIKLCKKMEKKAFETFENDEENQLFATTIREVWEKFEVAVIRDKKRLLTNEINIQNLRKQYKEVAIKWFSSQYGIENKKRRKNSTCDHVPIEDNCDNKTIKKKAEGMSGSLGKESQESTNKLSHKHK